VQRRFKYIQLGPGNDSLLNVTESRTLHFCISSSLLHPLLPNQLYQSYPTFILVKWSSRDAYELLFIGCLISGSSSVDFSVLDAFLGDGYTLSVYI
jgi:hypothetical protein